MEKYFVTESLFDTLASSKNATLLQVSANVYGNNLGINFFKMSFKIQNVNLSFSFKRSNAENRLIVEMFFFLCFDVSTISDFLLFPLDENAGILSSYLRFIKAHWQQYSLFRQQIKYLPK